MPGRFAEVAELADRWGFVASCFGSTLKQGTGRDLDVLMVSRFREQSNWQAFLKDFGGELVRRLERPERGSHSYEVAKGGKLFHFCFGRF